MITHLKDLNHARCVFSSDLVAQFHDGGAVTIYHRSGQHLERAGTYTGPAAALAALDVTDDER